MKKILLLLLLTSSMTVNANELQLWVVTEPADAGIRIMNIRPRYHAGMTLKPGRYDIEVSKSGYQTQRQFYELAAGQQKLTITLQKQESIIIDIAAGTVNGVSFQQQLTAIARQLPAMTVKTEQYSSEGDQYTQQVLLFDGHRMNWYDGGISVEDAIFSTNKQLGVGSTLTEFDQAYRRRGQTNCEDSGPQAFYCDKQTRFAVDIDPTSCGVEDCSTEFLPSCRVSGLWIPQLGAYAEDCGR